MVKSIFLYILLLIVYIGIDSIVSEISVVVKRSSPNSSCPVTSEVIVSGIILV